MGGIYIFNILSLLLWLQEEAPLKPTSQFDVITNYQLKKKPTSSTSVIVMDRDEDKKETSTDLLPYLTLQIKVKHWNPNVDQVRIVDDLSKTRLKKKVNDSGIYDLDMGFVDDIKDGITSGKFSINFLEKKKVVEMITITVERDGTFLVNSEKRGKF